MKNNSILEPIKNKKTKTKNLQSAEINIKDSGYLHEWKLETKKRRMKKLKWWGLAFAALTAAVLITVFINVVNLNEIKRQQDEFLAQITPVPTQESADENAGNTELEYSPEFEKALKMYPDAVGYLKIADTNIDFPIVQGEDNYFFENRNYDRTYSEVAATYMLSECDPDSSRHLIIYGENSEIEGRFGELNSFLDYDVFYTHEYITLELEDGAQIWQVFSVHLSSTSFNYKDVDFDSNTEYLAYIKMFQIMSRFEKDIDLTEKDQVVTLVTDYHDLDLEEGYLMVHARRVG